MSELSITELNSLCKMTLTQDEIDESVDFMIDLYTSGIDVYSTVTSELDNLFRLANYLITPDMMETYLFDEQHIHDIDMEFLTRMFDKGATTSLSIKDKSSSCKILVDNTFGTYYTELTDSKGRTVKMTYSLERHRWYNFNMSVLEDNRYIGKLKHFDTYVREKYGTELTEASARSPAYGGRQASPEKSVYTGTGDDIYDQFGKKSKKMVGMCVPTLSKREM